MKLRNQQVTTYKSAENANQQVLYQFAVPARAFEKQTNKVTNDAACGAPDVWVDGITPRGWRAIMTAWRGKSMNTPTLFLLACFLFAAYKTAYFS